MHPAARAACLLLALPGCAPRSDPTPAAAVTSAGPRPSPSAASARTPPLPPPEVVSAAPPATPAPPAASAAPAGPAPLAGPRLRALAVPGHAEAVVAVPLGATAPRPVLVATHGNYDRPEWQCQVWAAIVGARGFVLCPRGVRRGDSPGPDDPRFEYASNQALEREIDAARAALKREFAPHVADGPVVFAGFSLGAIMGVTIATRRPDTFPRLVLIEGGDRWTLPAARTFRSGGGQRVLLACSQPGCAAAARAAVATLRKAEVEAELVKGKTEGHTYVGDVMERYAERFAWVVEGDERWRLARSPACLSSASV